jgi:hypothetical protein
MAKFPPTKVTDKVSNPAMINLVVTLLVGIATKTPLSTQPWLAWLQDATIVAALITLIGAGVGYSTEETVLPEDS